MSSIVRLLLDLSISSLLRQLGHQVGDCYHVEDVKGLRAVLEVDTADHATANDADFDLSHSVFLFSSTFEKQERYGTGS